jgi:hypothetical protein
LDNEPYSRMKYIEFIWNIVEFVLQFREIDLASIKRVRKDYLQD